MPRSERVFIWVGLYSTPPKVFPSTITNHCWPWLCCRIWRTIPCWTFPLTLLAWDSQQVRTVRHCTRCCSAGIWLATILDTIEELRPASATLRARAILITIAPSAVVSLSCNTPYPYHVTPPHLHNYCQKLPHSFKQPNIRFCYAINSQKGNVMKMIPSKLRRDG